METNNPNNNDKKPKRPRIGASRPMNPEQSEQAGYSRPEGAPDAHSQAGGSEGYAQQDRPYRQNNYNRQGGYDRPQRPYGQRPYNNNGGGYDRQQRPYGQRPYNNYNNNYNRQGGYNNRPYNPGAPKPEAPQQEGVENTAAQATPQAEGGYTPGGYDRPRSYNPNYNRQGGYNNNRQGGYNNNRQGGYNNNRQGGYNNNRQGGYNNNRQGGYGQQNRQGGYNNNRPGGYNNNNRQGGGYGQQNRQGGYNNNRPGQQQNRQRHNQFGMPHGGKSFVPRPKPVEYEMPIPDPDEQIRLNKYMANAGICSRREADDFIQQGLVKVNGEVVTELGTKITHNDTVEYDDKVVTLERKCYILLNKPKDCVTTSDDPNGRLTVMDIVKGACNERIYPVGRLDRNTTGVLLLTNDGDLASKLTHPKYVKKKIYHVWTDKDIAEDDMQRIADGIELEDGPIHADAISYATDTDRNQAGIEIHSGRNRIVRRIFESLGYHVTKLDRVYFAGLTKKNLPRGRWRYLTQEEVNFLKMGSFE